MIQQPVIVAPGPPLTASAIVVSYNRFAALCDTVRDLEAQTRAPDEIIVIDQSRDENGRAADRGETFARSPRVCYVHQEAANAQVARNRAILMARGEVLLFVDDDVRIPTSWVQAHLINYLADPSLDGVAGQVQYPPPFGV